MYKTVIVIEHEDKLDLAVRQALVSALNFPSLHSLSFDTNQTSHYEVLLERVEAAAAVSTMPDEADTDFIDGLVASVYADVVKKEFHV